MRSLILSDGSLPALVAMAMASEEIAPLEVAIANDTRAHVLPSLVDFAEPALTPAHIQAVTRQTALCLLTTAQTPPVQGIAAAQTSLTLLNAAYTAAQLGCSRLIWPINAGGANPHDVSLDRLAAIVDRARVISRLVTLDAHTLGIAVTIDAPLADLTDAKVADLALDLGAPLDSCWWWAARQSAKGSDSSSGGADPAAPHRARWTAALIAVGWSPTHTPLAARNA
jgi:hypothetical protein